MKQNRDLPAIEHHLKGLSERVRALRARRGMTRKDLSRDSGISERYLAQLESGEANPSVALLWRIANAMDIDFLELLSERGSLPIAHPPLWELLRRLSPAEQQGAYEFLTRHFVERDRAGHGVALIGLRGAGKTTLGERLAAVFGVPFVRLGQVIEELGGMLLGETFSLGGQKAYRRLERQAVEHVMGHYPVAIVEAGGSIVSELSTFNKLRSAYFTVWLRAAPEDHMNRVIEQGDLRPMEGNTQAMDDLRRILAEREPYYRTADHSIYTSGRSIEDCQAELERVCGQYLSSGAAVAERG